MTKWRKYCSDDQRCLEAMNSIHAAWAKADGNWWAFVEALPPLYLAAPAVPYCIHCATYGHESRDCWAAPAVFSCLRQAEGETRCGEWCGSDDCPVAQSATVTDDQIAGFAAMTGLCPPHVSYGKAREFARVIEKAVLALAKPQTKPGETPTDDS